MSTCFNSLISRSREPWPYKLSLQLWHAFHSVVSHILRLIRHHHKRARATTNFSCDLPSLCFYSQLQSANNSICSFINRHSLSVRFASMPTSMLQDMDFPLQSLRDLPQKAAPVNNRSRYQLEAYKNTQRRPWLFSSAACDRIFIVLFVRRTAQLTIKQS